MRRNMSGYLGLYKYLWTGSVGSPANSDMEIISLATRLAIKQEVEIPSIMRLW